MQILIVEDEPLAVQKLIKLLGLLDQSTQVVGATDGIESTVDWLRTYPMPELILMDIELADGQSFEIFNQVSITCPVIFTTSYDEYAIESFRLNRFDYLLKPIKKDELEQAIHRLRNRPPLKATTQIGHLVQDLRKQVQSQAFRNQLLVKLGKQWITVDTADIAYFRSQDGTTYLYGWDKTAYVVEYSLDTLQEVLAPTRFFRINPQFLIEGRSISQIRRYLNGKLRVELKPDAGLDVWVSHDSIKGFHEWLNH